MQNQQSLQKTRFPRAAVMDKSLEKDETYQQVMDVLAELWRAGMIQRGGGYCIGMSDLVVTMLRQKGIHSRMVECKLTVLGSNPPTMALVGHQKDQTQVQDSDVDTHCVVIVDQGQRPLLIDCSIGQIRPIEIPYICDELNGKEGEGSTLLAEFKYGTSTWIYHGKEQSRIPHIHQFSMVERIQTDRKMQREMSRLKIAIVAVIAIVALNFLRGAWDIYQTYYVEGNFWGPSINKKIMERLDRLEHSNQEQNRKLDINTGKGNQNGQ